MKNRSDSNQGKLLVLFIHGLGGNAVNTWRASRKSKPFGALIEEHLDVDCAYHSYPTSLLYIPVIRSKPPSLRELADGLKTSLDHQYQGYEEVVLVCHSLGGLVAKSYLLNAIKDGQEHNVRHAVMFATPHDGSSLANIASVVSRFNRQIRQLCKNSDAIESIRDDWRRLDACSLVKVTNIYGSQDRAVSRDAALAHGYVGDQETVNDRGHINIVKPNDEKDLCVKIVRSILEIELKLLSDESGSDVIPIGEKEARSFLDQSFCLYAESQYDTAYQSIKKAYSELPNDSEVIRQYARVCSAQRRHVHVKELYGERYRQGDCAPPLACALGEASIREEKYENALEYLLNIEEREYYNVEYLTGSAYLMQYRVDKDNITLRFAREHFSLAAKHFPEHWWVNVAVHLASRIQLNKGLIEKIDVSDLQHDTLDLLNSAISKEERLFSARIYRLLYFLIRDELDKFKTTMSADIEFLKPCHIQTPKNFPQSFKYRLELLYADREKQLVSAQHDFDRWITSL